MEIEKKMIHKNKKLVAITNGEEQRKTTMICWYLFAQCNFSCTYCRPGSEGMRNFGNDIFNIDQTSLFSHFEQLLRLIKEKERRPFLNLTGGEPTLWKELPRFIKSARGHGADVAMSSNGSAPMSFWEVFREEFKWLVFSYHPEFSNEEDLLDKCSYLGRWVPLTIRICMEPQYWDRCLAFAEKVRKLPQYALEFVPLIQHFGSANARPWDYSATEKDFFFRSGGIEKAQAGDILINQEHSDFPRARYLDQSEHVLNPNELIVEQKNHFFGWECSAGIEELYINHAGDIFRANCLIDGPIGNIFKAALKELPSDPVLCTKRNCLCNSDIMLSKKCI